MSAQCIDAIRYVQNREMGAVRVLCLWDRLSAGGASGARAEAVTQRICAAMPGLGVRVLGMGMGLAESPLLGGGLGGKKKRKGTGNRDWLVLLEPVG